jgi:glycosyltransferase involved in cell wall biosynthesis
MRILQLTNKPPYPDIDGGAIAVLNLTKGLAGLGHEITVLAMNTLKHHINHDEIPPHIKKLADFRFVEVPAHISAPAALLNLLFSEKPYNAVRFISDNYKNALTELLQEKKFNVVQLEGLYVCPYIPLIRKYSDALIVYRAHNVEFEIWERTVALSSGLRKWYIKNLANRIRRFEISWLNKYDLLVPITPRDGQILNQLGNHRPVHVSPTGIDFSVLIPHQTQIEYPTLFHLGSLEWSPNQEGLLWFLKNCWPRLNKKFPELKFYVAGRNAPSWLIDKLKMPGVVYEGEVADAYKFMNSKSIMVVPLFSGSGMRIKIIEGMALGKAIVSTSIGAEGIGVEHGKNIQIADDEESFIVSVEKLINNKSMFAEQCRESILLIQKNFDNLALAEKLARFYQNNLT